MRQRPPPQAAESFLLPTLSPLSSFALSANLEDLSSVCLALGLALDCGKDGNPVSWSQELNPFVGGAEGRGLLNLTQGPSDRARQNSESALCPGQSCMWELSRRDSDPRWHLLPFRSRQRHWTLSSKQL